MEETAASDPAVELALSQLRIALLNSRTPSHSYGFILVGFSGDKASTVSSEFTPRQWEAYSVQDITERVAMPAVAAVRARLVGLPPKREGER